MQFWPLLSLRSFNLLSWRSPASCPLTSRWSAVIPSRQSGSEVSVLFWSRNNQKISSCCPWVTEFSFLTTTVFWTRLRFLAQSFYSSSKMESNPCCRYPWKTIAHSTGRIRRMTRASSHTSTSSGCPSWDSSRRSHRPSISFRTQSSSGIN